MAEKKIYYLTEIPSETAAALSAACDSFASLCAGKLDILEPLIIAAYKKRTGNDMNEIELEQVRNSLKLVQFLGWDSTYGSPNNNIHGYTNVGDILFDVSEVLNYQLADDGSAVHSGSRYPMHWNDKTPLCRIIRKTSSVYNRNKQLNIFPNK